MNIDLQTPKPSEPELESAKGVQDATHVTANASAAADDISSDPKSDMSHATPASLSQILDFPETPVISLDNSSAMTNVTAPEDTEMSTISAVDNIVPEEIAPASTYEAITVDQLAIDSGASDDADSALGDMIAPSSTASVRSSIFEAVEENGRTYHSFREGKYVLPNDETEQNRLDLQHHLFLLTLSGELHLAPLSSGIQRALDIATGTGIWAIEFATKYPSAQVIGTDLSPIQPLYVPPNCQFEVDDAEEPWLYAHKFDYIHGRLLVTCFRNFPGIVSQAFTFLNPGGYFELQDILPPTCYDNSWEGTALKRLTELLTEGGAKLGMDWQKASKYQKYLTDAGFEDVQELHFAWPSNEKWPKGVHYKTLGLWYYQNMMDGIQGISMAVLTRVWGWTKDEVDIFMIDVKRDYADRNIRCYQPVRVVWGRKPVA